MDISTTTTAPPKISYSAPGSPATTATATIITTPPSSAHSSPASGVSGVSSSSHRSSGNNTSTLSTPKKHLLDTVMLHALREKLRSPRGVGLSEQHNSNGGTIAYTTPLPAPTVPTVMNIIKQRYLISSQPCQISAAAAAKTPASYRHLIDLTSSNLRCTDIFTERQYLCKIINEPLPKVQRAYFDLKLADGEGARSTIHGHRLIRGVHDLVRLNAQRTYVIVAANTGEEEEEEEEAEEAGEECSASSGAGEMNADGVYEDLHTYIRNKRRLGESEARALFHQICQTVQVCHRNGIILRDLKLKRFYFVDAARTKLQYESLEGSMILDEPTDDILSDKIGCPLYTAPELLCPHPTYRGRPADMWSLGVILYTMLVGQYPFYEKGNCNLITIIRHCHVQIPQTLSRSVRWLLMALLRKQYEERMTVEQIFMTPWLREQRPYYCYVPVAVHVAESENEDNDGDDSCMKQIQKTLDNLEETQLQALSLPHESVASAGATSATEAMESSDVDADTSLFCFTATTHVYAGSSTSASVWEREQQPLDYTRHALQQRQQQQQHQYQDVEMAG